MISFRDEIARQLNLNLIVHTNTDARALTLNPFDHGRAYTDAMKTDALKQALDRDGYDAVIGGARRDEEKSRAKERIFSVRSAGHRWNPKAQPPEIWNYFTTKLGPGETMRVFPLSNWTELDVWQYVRIQSIPILPLYFAAPRPVVKRNGQLFMVDDERMRLIPGETPSLQMVRFRTLGCYPLTAAIESPARDLDALIAELLASRTSERSGRIIDRDSPQAMERKKIEGYF